MPTRLLLAPATAGKTAYALALARERAQGLRADVRVVVPTALQAASWRRRLAMAGGSLGVRVLTFDGLTAACLDAAGVAVTELTDPVQARLLRALLDRLDLTHYRPLIRRPGFVAVLQELFAELKRGLIRPEALAAALADQDSPPRLTELARIYAAYQEALADQGWADRDGLLWLAIEALQRHPHLAADWSLVIVDGFDQVDTAQLELLRLLAGRIGELVVTLTGGAGRYPRFTTTRRRLEKALDISATPLPDGPATGPPDGRGKLRPYGDDPTDRPSHSLTPSFSNSARQRLAPQPTVYIEAPDPASEVRAALRWLKARLVVDRLSPEDVAILARDLAPYRPYIGQIAAEFGLPIRLVDGLPLATNPAVSALLNLLRLMLPAADGAGPALPRRETVAVWRSPYFDWCFPPPADPITLADADRLDAASRHALVLGGPTQWREALDGLAALGPETTEIEATDLDEPPPPRVPTGANAAALRAMFDRFVARLTPPGPAPLRDFVAWLAGLIGPDPAVEDVPKPDPWSLNLFARAGAGPEDLAARDVAALRVLQEVLRGLAWAEAAIGPVEPVGYARFLDELAGTIEATTYRLPSEPGAPAILAANVVAARGLPFIAVALLGLAEGVFPAPQREDPLLRDADRARLGEHGLILELKTLSAEREFFYEAMARASTYRLLTRPRLEETGAEWLPSPFWDEARRADPGELQRLATGALPPPEEAASWPELLAAMAAMPGPLPGWLLATAPTQAAALEKAAQIVRARESEDPTPFDGDLGALAPLLAEHYGPGHVWSPSRLEQIHTCGYLFFVASFLDLAPRPEPTAGLEPVQLGTIYHQILEALYQRPGATAATGEDLAALVERVAAPILDDAPRQGGFRETAWWRQTRREILGDVARTADALNELSAGHELIVCEARFGLDEAPPLTVAVAGRSFQLRGIIDRVDRGPRGRLRVIDYKSAGPTSYGIRDFAAGKRLQLPLYALAARDALALGEVGDGFYWHIRQAEPSALRLTSFEGGPEAALTEAARLAWAAVQAARAGAFRPRPPATGCPPYCPAAPFCRHYRPGW